MADRLYRQVGEGSATVIHCSPQCVATMARETFTGKPSTAGFRISPGPAGRWVPNPAGGDRQLSGSTIELFFAELTPRTNYRTKVKFCDNTPELET